MTSLHKSYRVSQDPETDILPSSVYISCIVKLESQNSLGLCSAITQIFHCVRVFTAECRSLFLGNSQVK